MVEEKESRSRFFDVPHILPVIQQTGFPGTLALQHLADTVQTIVQAQFELGHALLAATMSLSGAWLSNSAPIEPDLRPSLAAQSPEYVEG